MAGVMGKGSANESFRISHHVSQSHFCETGAGFAFDLEVVRDAQKKIEPFSWKKVIAPAIHQYARLQHAEADSIAFEREKMNKLIAKCPELRQLLPKLNVRPSSGEYAILSWLNIEQLKSVKSS